MPRRDYQHAQPGQLYASEWPEWHVDCATSGCDEHECPAGLGEAMTLREAERMAHKNLDGWVRRGGLWYCPKHAAEARPQ